MLENKTILITGAARRLGHFLALAAARQGASLFIHHSNSPGEAEETAAAIRALGAQAWVLQADFSAPAQAEQLMDAAWRIHPVDFLVNNAAIFAALDVKTTTLADWQQHLDVNLTAPFILSQAFARLLNGRPGRIVNILDWRALRPGADHLPYTISKAGLAALTRSLAVGLAPAIQVNGLALGAVLPPSDGASHDKILLPVPAGRWADLDEIARALFFLLTGPEYMTGEIIHLDGGRHLV